ncbi:hypothetical protein HNQ59_003917, partial [Chitinivorax tropicus]
TLAAQGALSAESAQADTTLASPKRIVIQTAGGASLTLDGGFSAQCPGELTIHAASRTYQGPGSEVLDLPKMPSSLPFTVVPKEFKLYLSDTPGKGGHPLAFTPWKISKGSMPSGMGRISDEDVLLKGRSDENGFISLSLDQQKKLSESYFENNGVVWLSYPGHVVQIHAAEFNKSLNIDESLRRAMNSADFSDELRSSLYLEGAMDEVLYAKDSQQVVDFQLIARSILSRK